MKCVGCGREMAQAAQSCMQCGAVQPAANARAASVTGEIVEASGEPPAATGAPKRGGSIAFVIGTLVAVALVAVAAWRVLDAGSGSHDLPAVGEAATGGASGQVPPPANQSAAPIPPPDALPPVDDKQPLASTGGSDGAGSDTSKVEESAPAAVSASATQGNATVASGATPGKTLPVTPPVGSKAAQRPARPARAAPPKTAAASAKPATSPKAPAAKAAATTAPAPAQVQDRWARMDEDMAKCTREDFINRVICAQRVKFRYCGDYWGKVPQCPGSPPSDHG